MDQAKDFDDAIQGQAVDDDVTGGGDASGRFYPAAAQPKQVGT